MDINKKIEIMPTAKWLWSFSPQFWGFVLGLMIAGIAAVSRDNRLEGAAVFFLIAALEFSLVFGIFVFHSIWKGFLREYIINWWKKRPKLDK